MSGRKLLALVLLIFVLGSLAFAARFAWFAFTPAVSGSNETVVIEVRRGEGPIDVAKQLAAKGVITDARKFLWLGRLTRSWKNLKAGEYLVSPGNPPLGVLATVTSGVSIQHPVTVREGVNMYEIADLLSQKGLADRTRLLELCRDPKFIASLGFAPPLPPTLEGYLYPETYNVNRAMAPEDILKLMVKRFQQVAWNAESDKRARELGMSKHQVITLASMIEKETGAPEERPMISSVFHNRLRKRMRLQSDPTTIYGLWENYRGNIRRQDLATVNPYNTYTVPALPAGPIGNPGRQAIQAALFPAASEFLFFVSHNDGTHEFTRTYDEHRGAVRKFQLDPKAREGKSWRDRLKTGAAAGSPVPPSPAPGP